MAETPWPIAQTDNIFTANSLHIMSTDHVEDFFAGVGKLLQPDGKLIIYGPLKYQGDFTTKSNAGFDVWLKNRDPRSGVRDFEWLCELADQAGCAMLADHAMPANNQLLVFQKASR